MKYKNNLFNIRYNSNFQGVVANNNGFCEFSVLDYSVRAALVILRTYAVKYNLYTISQIIHRWAPPSENNTSAYTSFVCDKLNVCRSFRISVLEPVYCYKFLSAVAQYEVGRQLYPSEFDAGYTLFLKTNFNNIFYEESGILD